MFSRLIAVSVIAALTAATTPILSSELSPAPRMPVGYTAGVDRAGQLAALTGRSPAQIQIDNVQTITLIDGRQLQRVKAVDTRTGDILGATFDGDQIVDEAALRAQAGAAWRAQYGAFTPDLVQALDQAGDSAVFDIAVWLAVDIEPLPKPDMLPQEDGRLETSQSDGVSERALGEGAPSGAPDEKIIAEPLATDAAGLSQITPQSQADEALPPPPKKDTPQSIEDTPARIAAREQAEAFDRLNQQHLRAQIAPARDQFLALAGELGLAVTYASDIAPVVHLSGVTREQLAQVQRAAGIDALYPVNNQSGPAMAIARPTQNADLVETFGGYTGNNVNVAVVEGERSATTNPYLTIVASRVITDPRSHPTAVAGMIASRHSSVRGIAPNARVYSANGDNYATIAALEAAMDWGSTNARVLNHSFWAGDCGTTASLLTIDRHMDYIVRNNYDLAVVASGNFKTANCQDPPVASPFVNSPGKGYNALTVGNYDDVNTLGWSDDAMRPSSQYNDSDRFKPEMVAVGTNISSTTPASPWIGSVGSGTSYAAPMVAGTAATIIEAVPSIASYPEALTALLMATALHNITGTSRLSRPDGVGGLVSSAALVSAERGHWSSQFIDINTSFPITFTQFAHKGERVRFVIRWLSNPTADYTSDLLPADLDLSARRADGVIVDSSNNAITNFEVVDFIAPASETYRFVVTRFGSWSGGGTWLGAGWWRGTYRISPEAGYSDPMASPMGTFLTVLPSDWSPADYWRAMGIRSVASDHDLRLYSRSWFDDPSQRAVLAVSTQISGLVDLIAVDGNHWPSANLEYYRVNQFAGSGGYRASRSNLGAALGNPGTYGPYSMGSDEVVKVFDVYFQARQGRRISIVPTGSNATDLAAALFRSTGGTSSTWAQGLSSAQKIANASATPSFTERLSYLHNQTAADWLGLVVYSNQNATGQFHIVIEDIPRAHLPIARRP